ncbi:30S ribosomal protein S1, partial [Amycolatopsis sp. NPDC051758]
AAEYDTEGNYIYPEGFDPDTQEWQEGFDKQRQGWEERYAAARARFDAHMRQARKTAELDGEAARAESGSGQPQRSDGSTPIAQEELDALRKRWSGDE